MKIRRILSIVLATLMIMASLTTLSFATETLTQPVLVRTALANTDLAGFYAGGTEGVASATEGFDATNNYVYKRLLPKFNNQKMQINSYSISEIPLNGTETKYYYAIVMRSNVEDKPLVGKYQTQRMVGGEKKGVGAEGWYTAQTALVADTWTRVVIEIKSEHADNVGFKQLPQNIIGNKVSSELPADAYVDVAAWGVFKDEYTALNYEFNMTTPALNITFMDGDETLKVFSGRKGATIDAPTPTKAGRTLLGWSLTKGSTTTVDLSTLEGSITLYAVWSEELPDDLSIVYLSDSGDDTYSGYFATNPVKTLNAAIDKIQWTDDNKGTVVVVDSYTPVVGGNGITFGKNLPGKLLTITGADANSTINYGGTIRFQTDTVIENIILNRTAGAGEAYMKSNKYNVTYGEGLTFKYNGTNETIRVAPGDYDALTNINAVNVFKSGNFSNVMAAFNYPSSGGFTGNITNIIDGATVDSFRITWGNFSTSAKTLVKGVVEMIVNSGTVNKISPMKGPSPKGYIHIQVNGGNIKAIETVGDTGTNTGYDTAPDMQGVSVVEINGYDSWTEKKVQRGTNSQTPNFKTVVIFNNGTGDGATVTDTYATVIKASGEGTVKPKLTMPTAENDYVCTFDGFDFVTTKAYVLVDGVAYNSEIHTFSEAKTYNIAFSDVEPTSLTWDPQNGESPTTVNYVANTEVILPETEPTKDGYYFVGWNTDKDATDTLDFGAGISFATATTLYAIYEEAVSTDGVVFFDGTRYRNGNGKTPKNAFNNINAVHTHIQNNADTTVVVSGPSSFNDVSTLRVNGTTVYTSVYGGVDYRTTVTKGGAGESSFGDKAYIILKKHGTQVNTGEGTLEFNNIVTIDDYDTTGGNAYSFFNMNGKTLILGEGVYSYYRKNDVITDMSFKARMNGGVFIANAMPVNTNVSVYGLDSGMGEGGSNGVPGTYNKNVTFISNTTQKIYTIDLGKDNGNNTATIVGDVKVVLNGPSGKILAKGITNITGNYIVIHNNGEVSDSAFPAIETTGLKHFLFAQEGVKIELTDTIGTYKVVENTTGGDLYANGNLITLTAENTFTLDSTYSGDINIATAENVEVMFLNNGVQVGEVVTLPPTGGEITFPAAPTAPDHKTFDGWTDGTNTYAAESKLTVTESKTFSAKYSDVTYYVSFGGMVTYGTYGAEKTALAAPTPPAGKQFVCWRNTVDATDTLNAGESFTITGTKSYNAVFEDITYTVSFGETSYSKKYNETINVPAYTGEVPAGKTFAGWVSGETTLTAGATYTVTGNATFTAKFDAIATTYVVTFKVGDETVSTVSYNEGDAVVFPTEDPTAPAGKTFAGWAVEGTDTIITSYTVGTSAVTIVAVLKETVVVQIVGGSNINSYAGATITLPETATPTGENIGKRFAGWSTTEGGEVEYAGGATIIVPGAGIELYPVFTENLAYYFAKGTYNTGTQKYVVDLYVQGEKLNITAFGIGYPNTMTLEGFAPNTEAVVICDLDDSFAEIKTGLYAQSLIGKNYQAINAVDAPVKLGTFTFAMSKADYEATTPEERFFTKAPTIAGFGNGKLYDYVGGTYLCGLNNSDLDVVYKAIALEEITDNPVVETLITVNGSYLASNRSFESTAETIKKATLKIYTGTGAGKSATPVKEIELNEQPTNRITAYSVDLSAGVYTFEFHKVGYVTETIEVTVAEGMSDVAQVAGKAGDINDKLLGKNNVVDLFDFVRIARGFDDVAASNAEFVKEIDIDESGTIELEDLDILKSNFGYPTAVAVIGF